MQVFNFEQPESWPCNFICRACKANRNLRFWGCWPL